MLLGALCPTGRRPFSSYRRKMHTTTLGGHISPPALPLPGLYVPNYIVVSRARWTASILHLLEGSPEGSLVARISAIAALEGGHCRFCRFLHANKRTRRFRHTALCTNNRRCLSRHILGDKIQVPLQTNFSLQHTVEVGPLRTDAGGPAFTGPDPLASCETH